MDQLQIKDLVNIQGDILLNGFPKKSEIFCFFTIRAAQAFCKNIQAVANANKIASGEDIRALREKISKITDGSKIDVAKVNIAFTSVGLAKLSNVQSALQQELNALQTTSAAFVGGMQKDTERTFLGDGVFKNWNLNQNGGGSIDGVLIVAGLTPTTVKAELKSVMAQLNVGGEAVVELFREEGWEREAEPGHEHFGFNDGISHPQVFGIDDKLTFKLDDVKQPAATDKSNFVQPGIIVVGRKGDESNPKPQWMKDGSFLVFRKLEQHVEKWNNFVVNNWRNAGSKNPDQFGAQLMGRWKSGCPIHLQDQFDDDTKKKANDFTYGGFQKKGKCPLGAHIRKAHIRAGFDTSRIMRRGIPYGNDWKAGVPDIDRGLLFACYQSNIEEGYRFIQHDWANNPDFPSPKSGFDVTIGQGKDGAPHSEFTIGTNSATRINPMNEFVTAKGGEYFFAPSIPVLKAGFNINDRLLSRL